MTIDIHKRSEGVHYQMIPGVDDTEQAWNIRILEGKFSETVCRHSTAPRLYLLAETANTFIRPIEVILD